MFLKQLLANKIIERSSDLSGLTAKEDDLSDFGCNMGVCDLDIQQHVSALSVA